jgi:hypothetical protein
LTDCGFFAARLAKCRSQGKAFPTNAAALGIESRKEVLDDLYRRVFHSDPPDQLDSPQLLPNDYDDDQEHGATGSIANDDCDSPWPSHSSLFVLVCDILKRSPQALTAPQICRDLPQDDPSSTWLDPKWLEDQVLELHPNMFRRENNASDDAITQWQLIPGPGHSLDSDTLRSLLGCGVDEAAVNERNGKIDSIDIRYDIIFSSVRNSSHSTFATTARRRMDELLTGFHTRFSSESNLPIFAENINEALHNLRQGRPTYLHLDRQRISSEKFIISEYASCGLRAILTIIDNMATEISRRIVVGILACGWDGLSTNNEGWARFSMFENLDFHITLAIPIPSTFPIERTYGRFDPTGIAWLPYSISQLASLYEQGQPLDGISRNTQMSLADVHTQGHMRLLLILQIIGLQKRYSKNDTHWWTTHVQQNTNCLIHLLGSKTALHVPWEQRRNKFAIQPASRACEIIQCASAGKACTKHRGVKDTSLRCLDHALDRRTATSGEITMDVIVFSLSLRRIRTPPTSTRKSTQKPTRKSTRTTRRPWEEDELTILRDELAKNPTSQTCTIMRLVADRLKREIVEQPGRTHRAIRDKVDRERLSKQQT